VGEVNASLLKYGSIGENTGTPATTAFTLPGILFESCLAVLFF
jgi:hypothetical protein